MGVKEFCIGELALKLAVEATGNVSLKFESIITDSRSTNIQKNAMFVAIKGNIDGHAYIEEMYKKGVRIFLVEKNKIDFNLYPEAAFLIGENSLQTLQDLASLHRSAFDIPVLGITGSNGKTIVKEWLYQILSTDQSVCRSPRSYNSQLGVPLSVLHLEKSNDLAIFEAGISEGGEMDKLQRIIRPSIGVFTGLGSAHNEGFSNKTHKLQEKFKLFENCSKIIVNCLSDDLLEKSYPQNFFCISKKESADLQLINERFIDEKTLLTAKYQGVICEISIPFQDQASIQNALTCWATLLVLGMPQKTIGKKMQDLHSIEMRMELKQGVYSSSLINDSYNSDLISLSVAIDFLNRQKQHSKKIIILSDLQQTGQNEKELYHSVSKMIQSIEPSLFVGIGKGISNYKDFFKGPCEFYSSTEDFVSYLQNHSLFKYKDAAILLKGSRVFEFEKIQRILQQKSHDTRLEINLNSLINNLKCFRKKIRPETKIMAMVKAASYGSGSHEIASILEYNGIDYLSVAYADEGVELRKAGIKTPIMVMSPETDAIEDIIDFQLEPEVFSFRVLALLKEVIRKKALEKPFPIHIKLDTGMHRLGFNEEDLDRLIEELNPCPWFEIKSVFSHLVASDNPSLDDFSNQQIELFKKLSSKIITETNSSPILHLCNSGGISRFPSAHFDMVRLGIGLYGMGVGKEEQKELQAVSSLKTKVSQLRKVKKGDSVGYNRKEILTKDALIATLPIGYADGFSRKLGNGKGFVWIKGIPCNVVGNVCMDMIMVDVSETPVKEGDDVVIFENSEQIQLLADAMDSIPYEILTSVSSRVKRIFILE